MNQQLKKGILEICVLSFIMKEDRYGYEIVKEIGDIFEVKESTIYPILKRLSNDGLLDTYLQESSSGPARKYYKATSSARSYLDEEKTKYFEFVNIVTTFLSEY